MKHQSAAFALDPAIDPVFSAEGAPYTSMGHRPMHPHPRKTRAESPPHKPNSSHQSQLFENASPLPLDSPPTFSSTPTAIFLPNWQKPSPEFTIAARFIDPLELPLKRLPIHYGNPAD
jgi:hypothetical protein